MVDGMYEVLKRANQYKYVFFFKQKTSDKIRISGLSADVCSSDLAAFAHRPSRPRRRVWGGQKLCVYHWEYCAPPAPRPAFRWCGPDRPNRTWRGKAGRRSAKLRRYPSTAGPGDRKGGVWGKSVSVRVHLGGRRNLKKNNIKHN